MSEDLTNWNVEKYVVQKALPRIVVVEGPVDEHEDAGDVTLATKVRVDELNSGAVLEVGSHVTPKASILSVLTDRYPDEPLACRQGPWGTRTVGTLCSRSCN